MEQKVELDDSRIINYWQTHNIYKNILDKNNKHSEFKFIDGPPFASSKDLHFGHGLIGYIKSTVLNYQQMKGYNCAYSFGIDCHGLPSEEANNKLLGLKNTKEILDFGIDKYNTSCKNMINGFIHEWENIYNHMGRFVEYDKKYKTMDVNFMESVWWVFSEFYKKNLVYRGYRVMPYSNACGTPLSNFEASQN